MVLVAGIAFVGAEAVERSFRARRTQVEHTPRPVPLLKFALAGTLGLVLVVGLGLRPAPAEEAAVRPVAGDPVSSLELAERIIAEDPELMVVDLRENAEDRVPGAYPVAPDSTARAVLAGASAATEVVIVDGDGSVDVIPASWPAGPTYRVLRGGWSGWDAEVLTPAAPQSSVPSEIERVRRQNGISAYFSGAGTQSPQVAAPPPAIPSGGGGAKPKRGGC